MKYTTYACDYTCDLCHCSLDPIKPEGQYPDGWALSWTGEGLRRRLEPIRPWSNASCHLCQVCVRAVHEFFHIAEEVNAIQIE